MRARNIKPGFFKNFYLGKLSPHARLLFEGLWLLADKEGRLEDIPEEIKIDTLPYDDVDINGILDELTSDDPKKQFIIRYTVDGHNYIQIANFKKHQNPHPKEKESEIPAPPEAVKRNLITRQVLENPRQVPENPEREMLNPDTGILNPDTLTHESVCVCVGYVQKNQNPNLTNTQWVGGYLEIEIPRQKEKHSLNDEQIATCWRDAWDAGLAKGISSPNWFKTVFEGNCAKFHTKTAYPTGKPREVADSWAGIPRA